ncbi:MAG: DUF2306 domain-containing protein [Aliishimia sp.]
MPETFATMPLVTQIHIIAALTSVVLTPVQFVRRRGDRLHKRFGYVWVIAMAVTALSSFGINDIRLIGPFSPIHLLSAWVLFGLYSAILAARRGNIALHARLLRQNAFWGLGVAGTFTLIPGRFLSNWVFDGFATQGFVIMLIILLIVTFRFKLWRV